MRTAAGRDLRNHYTSLLSWVSAGAKIVGAAHFLTFDADQKRLAEIEGVTVLT